MHKKWIHRKLNSKRSKMIWNAFLSHVLDSTKGCYKTIDSCLKKFKLFFSCGQIVKWPLWNIQTQKVSFLFNQLFTHWNPRLFTSTDFPWCHLQYWMLVENIYWNLKKISHRNIFILPFFAEKMKMLWWEKIVNFWRIFSTNTQYDTWHHGESVDVDKSGFQCV